MSLEMAHKVILPPQKNYIPQFLKQRDINSYKNSDTGLRTYRTGVNNSSGWKHYPIFLCGHMSLIFVCFIANFVLFQQENFDEYCE
jgi:hypothetical protein